jgi:uncharacterized protein (DUF934 family)
MPRRLLRDGAIVADDWRYLTETDGGDGGAIILPLDRWLAERDAWSTRSGLLGVVLGPAAKAEVLVPDLQRFALIACDFTGPSEGRGYTQARLLRERWKFTGELRATGYVRQDQLFFMARCGFNAFELPDADLGTAATAFSTFSAAYQSSNDAGLAVKLRHR